MDKIITTVKRDGSLDLLSGDSVLAIVVDPNDCRGVLRAAKALGEDFFQVSAKRAEIRDTCRNDGIQIVVGTRGHSKVIDQLIAEKKIDTVFLHTHGEAFMITVIEDESMLVIAGSDRRGTIYGIYELSRQIGVNPWHFWLNLSPEPQQQLYALTGVEIKEYPRVQYRGIFLNDEAPALTNWILNTYGTVEQSSDPPMPSGIAAYGSDFYTKLFDLLLRLKANYLWPAMWNNAFSEDDPLNAQLADEWGIIMGTSHQEPMTRAQQEWDRRYRSTLGHWSYSRHREELLEFWRAGIRRNKEYDTVITIGLRGADDTPMGEESWRILEEIVEEQRKIISEEMGQPAKEVPQLWCLYKEVQQYYEEGMRVPDDVILLWSDDNWSNLRRVPTGEEQSRSGGAGIYYHFDYHGDPRNYQWINTTQISKIWDQMSLARRYGADRLWVVNVGHFRGQEYPISFFLDYAWNPEAYGPETLQVWSKRWCEAIFGERLKDQISSLVERIVELNSRRKPELLYPLAWSLTNYNEAEHFVATWQEIKAEAEALAESIPAERYDAYDHLIHFPARSSYLLASLYLAVGRNHLWARQGRWEANEQARLVQEYFSAFEREIERYHKECGSGMWRGFMDQPVIGYIDWNDPPKNTLEHIYTATVADAGYHRLGVAIEGSEKSWPAIGRCALPLFDSVNDQRRRIEIFNRSSEPYNYRVTVSEPWIVVAGRCEGSITRTEELFVSIDWQQAPLGKTEATVHILTEERYKEVAVTITTLRLDEQKLEGYVEADRSLVIDAIGYQEKVETVASRWQNLPDYGPFGAVRADIQEADQSAHLRYDCYFTHTGTAKITLLVSPLLNYRGEAIEVGISIDDGPIHSATVVAEEYQVELDDPFWQDGVILNGRKVLIPIEITSLGAQQLKIHTPSDGLLIERIICDLGGVQESLLGPPTSQFIG